jgi:RNA recognition motif-containing protein
MTDLEQKVELFIGALSSQITLRDLEHEFEQFGKLTRCDLKTRTRDSFAFVAFENHESAQKAMDAMQGTQLKGCLINIEWTNSKPRLRGGRREGEEDFRPRGGSSRRFGSRGGSSRYSPSRYSPYDRSRSTRRYSPRRRDSRERSPRRRYSRERSPRRHASRSPE